MGCADRPDRGPRPEHHPARAVTQASRSRQLTRYDASGVRHFSVRRAEVNACKSGMVECGCEVRVVLNVARLAYARRSVRGLAVSRVSHSSFGTGRRRWPYGRLAPYDHTIPCHARDHDRKAAGEHTPTRPRENGAADAYARECDRLTPSRSLTRRPSDIECQATASGGGRSRLDERAGGGRIRLIRYSGIRLAALMNVAS